jgi:hypothetical protein
MISNAVQIGSSDDAAAESLRLVEMNGGTLPGNRSLCLPATDTDPQSLRRFGYAVLFRLVAGFAGIAAGAIIAALQPEPDLSDWLPVALCCSVGGILLLLSNPFLQRWFVRRQVGRRYEELLSGGYSSSILCVGIEDANTFHRFKLFPEDLGYLALHPASGSVVIEGVRFRYLILGEDVRSVEQVSGGPTTATVIEYAVGNVILRIALQYDSIWHEFKRQTVGTRADPLIARIREALRSPGMLPPG